MLKSSKVFNLYIPEDFFDTWELFNSLVNNDEAIKNMAIKDKTKLNAIAIRELIKAYIKKNRGGAMNAKTN